MDEYILGKKMVKSVRRLNGKMCPESFPAKPLDFEIWFFVYLLDTYIYIHVGPHTRMGYLQIAHSCFTADSQSRLKDASGE